MGAVLEGDGGGIGAAAAGDTGNENTYMKKKLHVTLCFEYFFIFCLLDSLTRLNRFKPIRFVEGRSPLQLPRFNLIEAGWRGTTFG